MTVPSGTGALEATQQQVLSQLQSGLSVSVTSSAVADTVTTGNITAAQPTAGTVVAGGTVSITLGTGQGTWEAQLTGTFSSGTTIIFEGTDDTGVTTNWFTTVGYNTAVANPPNITSVGGPGPFVVRGSASGYQQIRMRASALTVSDNVAVRLIGSNAPLGLGGLSTNDGSFAKETGGNLASIKSDADTIVTNTTGLATASNQSTANSSLSTIATNTGRIPAQGAAATSASIPVNIASDQTVLIKGGFTEQASLSAGSLNADLIASTDVSAYRAVGLHVTGTFSATYTFQGSNDNSNFVSVLAHRIDVANGNNSGSASTTTNLLWLIPINYRYLRVRCTAYTSGAINGTAEFYTQIPTFLLAIIAASQSGTWTVQPGNTPNTSAWLVQDVVASSNGEVPYHNLSAASTNFTNVKGSACQMYSYALSNTSGSAIFVKFYDKATAPGTGDTPKRTIQVPANATITHAISKGMKFASGFGWAATGAVADNDNTSIAANCVVDFSLNS